MNKQKIDRLNKLGWQTGDIDDLLELTDAELSYIELKIQIGLLLKEIRQTNNQTQKQAAAAAETSQSRFVNLEAGDPSVTIDRQIRALFSNGATIKDIAKAINK